MQSFTGLELKKQQEKIYSNQFIRMFVTFDIKILFDKFTINFENPLLLR